METSTRRFSSRSRTGAASSPSESDRAPPGLFEAEALDRARDELLARLPELVGPDEPPARLHGDLWGGNLHVGQRGQPMLIDPAVYAGHREINLAMRRLFGGFGERAFDAYAASHPLAPGHRERVALYQLYPLLVHLCTFGTGISGRSRAASLATRESDVATLEG